jgi:hypothetical protein
LLGVFWEVKYFNQKWLHYHQLESYSKEDFLLGVFWEVKCFNQKWLHHHQLESYSKDKEDYQFFARYQKCP